MKKPGKEPSELATTGLSHTEAFVKEIIALLKQGLTAENYRATLQSVVELCKDNYDLNRAGAAAIKVAEKQPYKSETFNLYCKMAGDLYRIQCESERGSGRTTIFTGFYDSCIDAYLDGGSINEAAAVAFEHSHWLMTNALYRDEPGKQRYLELSVKALDEVMKQSKGDLAKFVYEQREGRRKAAGALRDIEPPAHLATVKDPAELEGGVRIYQDLISFLEKTCQTCDIAAYFSRELAAVLATIMPDRVQEYSALASDLEQRHTALLDEHGIPS